MNDETHTTSSTEWARGRAFRRVVPPLWPFAWRGLLPALGLVLLTLFGVTRFASTRIESRVAEHVSDALASSGHQWADLRVSGQRATLSGRMPQPLAGDAALEVAREATCPTWLGPKVCAASVVGDFVAVEASSIAASPTRGAPALEAAEVEACDATLADLLTGASIEFASASASIVASTEPLLDRIAAVVRSCPGSVRIEGHTDSTGEAEPNRTLSAARADAVRSALIARGIPADRLVAIGYGETNPIARNDTSAGRGRNRRIELRFQTTAN